jgi:uncharacterized membrane protein YhhN
MPGPNRNNNFKSMKKLTWLILFLALLAVNIVAVNLKNEDLRLISKPLLVPVLSIFFITSTKSFPGGLKNWIVLALFFSWAGDVFLLFESKDPLFFLLGLSSFLLAHIFYIVFFHNIRRREYIYGNALLLLVAVLYYASLMDILGPHLGTMKLPVTVYGVVISFMVMLALHTLFGKNKNAGVWMAIGAILFVLSDSILAFNKYYSPIAFADIFIMLTYGLAQLFIVVGAAKYINGLVKP